MKKIILFFAVLSNLFLYSQSNYFEGKNLYCKTENPEAKKLFNLGIETLHLNRSLNKKYLTITAEVFYRAYKTDTTFCDALFFSGYTFRLLGKNKEAIGLYYLADSLSNNKSIEFKINLAAEALKVTNQTGIKLARKKFNEIIQYFPESSEGYYGFALTSPEMGDVDKGLENINIAIEKFNFINPNQHNERNFLKGILLTLNKKYDEGLEYLEMCYGAYKKDFNYKVHYSLCLLKVSEIKNDEKMKSKAKKIYDKIDEKENIPKEIKDLLIF